MRGNLADNAQERANAGTRGILGRAIGASRAKGTTFLPLIGLWPAAALAFSSCGAQAVELRVSAGAGATTDIISTSEDIDLWLRLDNDTNKAVDVTIVARAPIRSAGGSCTRPDCELVLVSERPGQPQTMLAYDRPNIVLIGALGSEQLRLKGKLKELDRYVIKLRIIEPGQTAPAEREIAIRRQLVSLVPDSLKLDAKTQLTAYPNRSVPPVRLRLLNSSERVISAGPLYLELMGANIGGSEYTRPVDWSDRQKFCDPTSKTSNVDPGQTLDCSLKLPRLNPGLYQLTARATGPGLAASAGGTIEVRDSWAYALLTLLFGGLIGAAIAAWTGGGRDRVTLAIEAQSHVETLRQLHGAMIAPGPHTNVIVNHWANELAKLLHSLRIDEAGSLDSGSRIAAIGEMLPRIAKFAVAERNAQPVIATVQAAYDAANLIMEAATPDVAAADAALATLATAIETARSSVRVQGHPLPDESQLFVFSWKPGLSAGALRNLMRRYDRLILLISLAIAIAIGVLTLWVPDATWGSLANYLTALLTGVALTIGGTLSLQQIAEKYALPVLK